MATLTDKTVANTYDQLWFRGSTEPGGTTNATQVKTTENDGTDDLATPLYLGTARIGIGTSSPTEVLDVTGNGKFSGTLTCATSLTIGSAAMVEADLEKLDGITDGTAAANKAVVLDGSKNIATLGTVGCGAITSSGVVTGTGFTIGSAAIIESELEMLDGISAGTAAASKAVVLDSNKDIGTIRNLTINGVFTDGNYTFDTSGNVSGLGTVGCGAITTSGNLDFNAGTIDLSTQTVDVTLNAAIDALNFDSNTLSIDASNNRVGIGTAAPESTLHVLTANVGVVAIDDEADDFVIENTTNPGMTILGNNNATGSIFFGFEADPNIGRIRYDHSANRMDFTTDNDKTVVIDNAGSVGIGGVAPAGELALFKSGSPTSAGPTLYIDRNIADGETPQIVFRHSRHLTQNNAGIAVLGNDPLGAIYFQGADSSNYKTGAGIVAEANQTWNTGANGTVMKFYTCEDGETSPQARMTIADDGNVGIGIVAPANTLEVRGKTSDNCHFALSTVNADYDTYLHFAEVDNNRWSIYNDGVGGTAPGGGTEDNILTIADDDGVVSAMGQNDTTFAAPSDERMKENMVEMTGALENISDFRCVHYNFIHDRDNGKDIKRIGIIAQDIYKKYPEAVKGFPDSNFKYTPKKGTGKDKVRYTHEGAMSVKYPELIPVLIKAIQELSAEVEKLKNG